MVVSVVDIDKTGNNINNKIKESNYKLNEIAEILGVTEIAIYKWCEGKSLPKIDNLIILADIFKCEIQDLLITKKVEV